MTIEHTHLLHSTWPVPGLLAIGVFLSTTAGCGDKPTPTSEQAALPKVTTTNVIEQETTDFDEYTGRTEASEAVEIRARVFGYLKTIDFQDGDFVKEGQTLFTIEPDEYDAIHEQSLSKIAVWESKLEVAKANLARRKLLVPKGTITREEYEEYVAAVARSGGSSRCREGGCKSNRGGLEVHGRQGAHQRPNRSGLRDQGNAADRRVIVGHVADEDRQRAADVRLL